MIQSCSIWWTNAYINIIILERLRVMLDIYPCNIFRDARRTIIQSLSLIKLVHHEYSEGVSNPARNLSFVLTASDHSHCMSFCGMEARAPRIIWVSLFLSVFLNLYSTLTNTTMLRYARQMAICPRTRVSWCFQISRRNHVWSSTQVLVGTVVLKLLCLSTGFNTLHDVYPNIFNHVDLEEQKR